MEIQIFIKDTKTTLIRINKNIHISELKKILNKKSLVGSDKNSYGLIYSSNLLKDNQTIEESGIHDLSTIFLVHYGNKYCIDCLVK
jgi:hypothetical protein